MPPKTDPTAIPDVLTPRAGKVVGDTEPMPKIVAVIPARGGSVSIPKKNIKMLSTSMVKMLSRRVSVRKPSGGCWKPSILRRNLKLLQLI